jgi:hypothetical protein
VSESVISCRLCGDSIRVNSHRPITADDFACARCRNPSPRSQASTRTTDNDHVRRVRQLVALATDEAAPFGESANAARAACRIIAGQKLFG